MLLTMPVVIAFAVAMAVSNIELLRHERHRLWNTPLHGKGKMSCNVMRCQVTSAADF